MLLEQIEGDARAQRAAGAEETVQAFRERLDTLLLSEIEGPGRAVPAEERELRRALGVA